MGIFQNENYINANLQMLKENLYTNITNKGGKVNTEDNLAMLTEGVKSISAGNQLPDGGENGQVLTKTANGAAWETRETPEGARQKVEEHAADTALHPNTDKQNSWDGKLAGDNIQAGRNVTLDRIGPNIVINSDTSGEGGAVANADTVDGYHVDDSKTGTDETMDNALWTAHKIQAVAHGSKIHVAPETPAPTMENGDLWLITEAISPELQAVVYSNMVFSEQEPEAAENWGKIQFIDGKLKVNDAPKNSYKFFGDINATE